MKAAKGLGSVAGVGCFLVLFFLTVGPLLTIWSLNTMFDLGLEYTWKTWLAAAWLGGLVYGSTVRSKS